ncbi:MAG: MATE family efflux transporter [Clostridia bacterium]|nr:MATE family efflux transporter [Clostridia bacterium]
MKIKSLIGDRKFYKFVLAIMIPIMVQTGITNFVNMLDNVMIGALGTNETTGVAVANQLIFVFNLCIFGAVSGAGIFGAQFFGKGDHEGLKQTLRFKFISTLLITVAAIFLFIYKGDFLIGLYLQGEGLPEDIAASHNFSSTYLNIMLVGLIPYTISQCYSSTLRETGQTVLPMYAGVAAVGINLFLNWILIFGSFGAPKLGVVGGAIATVISRFAEMIIVILGTHLKAEKNLFVVGLYKSLYVPAELVRRIIAKGLPLLLNETFWAAGVAAANQAYSLRGLDVVAANNISQTFFNVFSVAFLTVGQAIGIILGQQLGAQKTEEARSSSIKLIAFSIFISLIVATIYFTAAEFIPYA